MNNSLSIEDISDVDSSISEHLSYYSEILNHTQSEFVRETLSDVSEILKESKSTEHLPYKLYTKAGEYWNRYPKTDYNYSQNSRDHVDLGDGYMAMPNLSRRSLFEFKRNGSIYADVNAKDYTTEQKAYNTYNTYWNNYTPIPKSKESWWLTQQIVLFWQMITTIVSTTYNKVTGLGRALVPSKKSENVASKLRYRTDPFYITAWRSLLATFTTTTTEETELNNHVNYIEERRQTQKRSLWPWLILPLLALAGLALYPYHDKAEVTNAPVTPLHAGLGLEEVDKKIVYNYVPRERCCKDIHKLRLSIEQMKSTIAQLVARSEVKTAVKEDATSTGAFDHIGRDMVKRMLATYDADKTGLVDYVLQTAGGEVLSTRCTELYKPQSKKSFFDFLPNWDVESNIYFAILPESEPGRCFAFVGFPGYIVLKTFRPIEVTGFSLEHASRLVLPPDSAESAPRKFSVYGLVTEDDPNPHHYGDYVYDINGEPVQHFTVQKPWTYIDHDGEAKPFVHDVVELKIDSNHGNPGYTCLYRFRVHGNPVLAEDFLKDSASTL